MWIRDSAYFFAFTLMYFWYISTRVFSMQRYADIQWARRMLIHNWNKANIKQMYFCCYLTFVKRYAYNNSHGKAFRSCGRTAEKLFNGAHSFYFTFRTHWEFTRLAISEKLKFQKSLPRANSENPKIQFKNYAFPAATLITSIPHFAARFLSVDEYLAYGQDIFQLMWAFRWRNNPTQNVLLKPKSCLKKCHLKILKKKFKVLWVTIISFLKTLCMCHCTAVNVIFSLGAFSVPLHCSFVWISILCETNVANENGSYWAAPLNTQKG